MKNDLKNEGRFGWSKLPNCIADNDSIFSGKRYALLVYIKILLSLNYKNSEVIRDNGRFKIKIKAGQYLTSIRDFQRFMGCSQRTIKDAINFLIEKEIIKVAIFPNYLLITYLHYNQHFDHKDCNFNFLISDLIGLDDLRVRSSSAQTDNVVSTEGDNEVSGGIQRGKHQPLTSFAPDNHKNKNNKVRVQSSLSQTDNVVSSQCLPASHQLLTSLSTPANQLRTVKTIEEYKNINKNNKNIIFKNCDLNLSADENPSSSFSTATEAAASEFFELPTFENVPFPTDRDIPDHDYDEIPSPDGFALGDKDFKPDIALSQQKQILSDRNENPISSHSQASQNQPEAVISQQSKEPPKPKPTLEDTKRKVEEVIRKRAEMRARGELPPPVPVKVLDIEMNIDMEGIKNELAKNLASDQVRTLTEVEVSEVRSKIDEARGYAKTLSEIKESSGLQNFDPKFERGANDLVPAANEIYEHLATYIPPIEEIPEHSEVEIPNAMDPYQLIPNALDPEQVVEAEFVDVEIIDPDQPKPKQKKTRKKKAETGLTVLGEGTAKVVEKTSGTKVFEAYSEAFQNRYNQPATRNAMVNKICSNLVQRLGEENAIKVVQFYVGHNDQFYVRNGHMLKLALSHAEKLLTEAVAGVQITSGKARQNEKHAEIDDVVRRYVKRKHGYDIKL